MTSLGDKVLIVKTKTVIVKINPNRVIETKFQSHDPVNDPVTVPEMNRIIAALRSEHQKYLRVFRMEQRLKANGTPLPDPALKK